MPSGWPIAIAPPFTLTLAGSRPSSRITASDCDAKASFSSTRSTSPTSTPTRSSSLRTAGTGPMPITRGSTPATALPTNVPSGSTPSSRAFSSDATTSAAAPSLSPDELPAVTVPPGRNAGFSVASFSALVSGRGCSSRATPSDRDELVVEPARLRSRRPATLRLERELVLILARDAPALGHVLAGLAHRLEREHGLELRVREAPAERRVPGRRVAARESLVRLGHRERRPRHRLDAAGDEEVSVPGGHGVTRRDDRRETRRAEPVDGDAGDGLRQAREEHGHARHVPVVLARLVRAAEVDVLDLVGCDARSLDSRGDRDGREVVGTHT